MKRQARWHGDVLIAAPANHDPGCRCPCCCLTALHMNISRGTFDQDAWYNRPPGYDREKDEFDE
jgi:hypothetical protein